MSKLEPTEVVIGPVRLSFPSLFKTKPKFKGSDKQTYQAALIIDPDDKTSVKKLKKALEEAMKEKFGKVVKIKKRNNPIRKCDDEDDDKTHMDGYEEGGYCLNAHAQPDNKPLICDENAEPTTDASKFYPGCYVNVLLEAYAWDHEASGKGVSFGLQQVQFVRDGERLGGGPREHREDVFEPVAAGDDDDLDSMLESDD